MDFTSATRKLILFFLFLLSAIPSLFAQPKKYPSLLWEITGNGLHQPSYLFGTMHVSSKMVFHLSDSFYLAIKSVDEVALEQNPLYWQRDMMTLDNEQQKIGSYMRNGANDYLNEKSFQPEKYEDDLRAALTDEPMVVNSLLYRNFEAQEDYEENTYLDLYIYQTGRKLGKKAAGVEDYYQTERIVFEAYQDAMKDKNKKERGNGDESIYEIEKKIQNAYRQGDLDMLDSLEKYEYTSPAFLEKFLYKRNEIQANSIDTILKHNSLFVGVGAAHLPGKRGVIELLRAKGYKLRPVLMQDRNADRKDEIDKMKVPVVFHTEQTGDGAVSMKLPGKLYKRTTAGYKGNESWQYADMENGTYYTIIRVKTSAALLGQSAKDMERKTDSLLYENIPGKILQKTIDHKDGFTVMDITNRTRRGDLQRYNIIITPFEEIVCKMSGNEDYVSGEEATTFFKSIHVNYHPQQQQMYTSGSGGFSVAFPQQPYYFVNNTNSDNIPRMQWEAVDSTTGTSYAVWKKTVTNFRFLEEDTFDLSLIEESIRRSDLITKETSRRFSHQNGYHSLDMSFQLKNGNIMSARAVLRGDHYYLISAVSKKKTDAITQFLQSFTLTDFSYPKTTLYQDTALHFTVQTPVAPQLDTFLMNMVSESYNNAYYQQVHGASSYRNNYRMAFFQDDSTGESILVNTTTYPKYFFSKDSARFWKYELYDDQLKDFIVKTKEPYRIDDSCSGYKMVLQDTNTVRQITSLILLKKNRLYRVTAVSDTLGKESEFIHSFLTTFKPDDSIEGEPVFTNKLDLFFADYNSKDSATQAFASDAVPNIPFTCSSVPQLSQQIASFHYGEKNYFENKTKFIRELGYINDSECVANTQKVLLNLYRKTTDTAYFQNEILLGLARLKTADAYDTLATLLLQDPPVFDDEYGYSNLFRLLSDSLSLSRRLFPDLLQLSSIDSYKEPVMNLLVSLVDSNLIAAGDYESYFSKIYFDAKIEQKKMQINDERLLQKENNEDDEATATVYPGNYHNFRTNSSSSDELTTYTKLLLPFYKLKASVPLYFSKLLLSQDPAVRLEAAIALAQNHQTVADSIWENVAANDKYRVQLLTELSRINRKNLFPKKYDNQEALAKSILLNDDDDDDKFQSLQLISKELVNTGKDTGYVYFFKYKMKKDDDWKMGISGLQPVNTKETSDNDEVTSLTDKRLLDGEPVLQQFADQLKELLFSMHESAYNFFRDKHQYENYYDDSAGN